MLPFEPCCLPVDPPDPNGRHFGSRVLVVDDEALNLGLMSEVCSALGLEVELAASGEEALVKLGIRMPFHLLITDIQMGGMTGLDLARQAQRLHPDMRILVYTGYAAEYFSNQPAVPWPVLLKPFDLSVMEDAIHGLMAVPAHSLVP